jgi:hypothetical protein
MLAISQDRWGGSVLEMWCKLLIIISLTMRLALCNIPTDPMKNKSTSTVGRFNLSSSSKCLTALILSTLNLQLLTFGQGSLTPPGAPAPTMKTLAQIEPRTPISSLPVTLSQPGAYYLTTNLTYTGGDGITVTATNVTIDLNGFALKGAGTNSTANGINSSGSCLMLRHGTIAGWLYGVMSSGPNNKIENVVFSSGSIAGGGVELFAGGNTVVGCNFENCGYGVYSAGSGDAILDCVVSGASESEAIGINVGAGCTVSRCTVSGGQGIGIAAYAATISHCTAEGNLLGGIEGLESLIIGCTTAHNGGDGIDSNGSCTIRDCAASYNAANGIGASGADCVIKDCTAGHNSAAGISAAVSCTIAGCNASYNTGGGITAGTGCTLIGCNVTSNLSAGISLGDDSVVKDCTVRGNSGAGLSTGNHLVASGCTLASNAGAGLTGGLVCKVADCVLVLNTGFGVILLAHGQVTGCHVNANTSGGVRVAGDSLVRDNMIDFHQTLTTTPGISVTGSANRIEANNVTRSGRGLDVTGTGNAITRNTVSGSTLNYNIVAGNNVGTIVQATLSGAIAGSTGGAGLGTTDPWANFSY